MGIPLITGNYTRAAEEAQHGRQAQDTDAMELQRQEVEQEVKLRLALQKDDAQVLERESADLAEAILRSQIEAGLGGFHVLCSLGPFGT